MSNLYERSDGGLGAVLRMTWPASLAMLNTTILKFVDGLMVSRVGPAPMAAQFFAGMTSFVPESFMLGVLIVVNTYVSQNLGAGRATRCGRYAWAGLALALAFGALVAPLAFGAKTLFSLMGHEEYLLEAMYFRYMILAVGLTLSCRVLESFFYGVHRPMIVLATNVFAMLFNILANYVLIFGHWGFPALGLEGAAIGSIISWTLQLGILLAVFLSPRMHRRFKTRLWRAVRWRQCRDLLRLGWPAGLQFCNDIFCWNVGVVVVAGIFGPAHRAATTIVMRYLGLSFMPAVGIGIATTALVGKAIGEGRPDLAKRRAGMALSVAAVYMAACGLAFWILRRPMTELFLTDTIQGLSAAEAARLAGQIRSIAPTLMLCAAAFQVFDALGIVYIGALRGAGDTLWPMCVTVLTSWTLVIGGGLLIVLLAPSLQSLGPWLAASTYVIVMGLLMLWRFQSERWRKIDLLGRRR